MEWPAQHVALCLAYLRVTREDLNKSMKQAQKEAEKKRGTR